MQLVQEDNERRAKLAATPAAADNVAFELDDDDSDDKALSIATRPNSAEILNAVGLASQRRSQFTQTAVASAKSTYLFGISLPLFSHDSNCIAVKKNCP